jgi:hypothetical protein
MHANRVCRFVCRFSAAKYDIWGCELRQVAACHREITAFCRYSVLPFSALQVRAFDHTATCPRPQIAQIDADLRGLAEGRLAGEGRRLKGTRLHVCTLTTRARPARAKL